MALTMKKYIVLAVIVISALVGEQQKTNIISVRT
jgi:hypothetical protein